MKRFRFFHRKALVRLGLLFLALLILCLWGYLAMFRMPGKSFRGPLPALTGEEVRLCKTLRQHVERLAREIGERTVFRPKALEAAAAWIEEELRGQRFQVERERFEARRNSCRNLIVEIPGGDRKSEIILIGAHYDSVIGCPGANDNGTGVAALLEIARALRGTTFRRTVRLVAFANEEPPFFQTAEMGSLVHARACRSRGENIAAMISLETLGCYRDEPGSQSYPPLFRWIYPNTGNFIGFVGNYSSRKLVRKAIRLFRENTRFPSEGGAPFGWVPGVGWSDHWSFWQAGYPGIMVTDTAPFRYPHYHERTDTPDRVDHERLARVVQGLGRVVAGLADGE